jgi:DNA polymerase III delta prime subunit
MEVSGGDMRKAVTFLQSAHDLSGKNNVVSHDMVFDVSGRVWHRKKNSRAYYF